MCVQEREQDHMDYGDSQLILGIVKFGDMAGVKNQLLVDPSAVNFEDDRK